MAVAAMRATRRSLLVGAVAAWAGEVLAAPAGIPQRITIARRSDSNQCTSGYLAVDGNVICYTLELPDRNNQKFISRIPAGTYPAHLRFDHPDKWRIELEKVRGHRDNIQIHVGNWPFQSDGCLMVGVQIDLGICKALDSVGAYKKLRRALYGDEEPKNAAPVFDLTVEVS